jgi:hypothetical protein
LSHADDIRHCDGLMSIDGSEVNRNPDRISMLESQGVDDNGASGTPVELATAFMMEFSGYPAKMAVKLVTMRTLALPDC